MSRTCPECHEPSYFHEWPGSRCPRAAKPRIPTEADAARDAEARKDRPLGQLGIDGFKRCPTPDCHADVVGFRVYHDRRKFIKYKHTGDLVQAVCLACQTSGPGKDTQYDAREAWNAMPRRGDLPQIEPKKPATVLRALADDFIESRRYVRTSPATTPGCVGYWLDRLADTAAPAFVKKRIRDNINVAIEFIQVDPAWLENALYNAAAELRLEASRMEPKEDPA